MRITDFVSGCDPDVVDLTKFDSVVKCGSITALGITVFLGIVMAGMLVAGLSRAQKWNMYTMCALVPGVFIVLVWSNFVTAASNANQLRRVTVFDRDMHTRKQKM